MERLPVGNTPGDTSVVVHVGTLPGGGGSTTISFRVTIIDPVPAGVRQVSNQAVASGTNFTTTLQRRSGDDRLSAIRRSPS